MLCFREVLELELKGTSILENVKRDEKSMSKEFRENALPFIKKYPQHFS